MQSSETSRDESGKLEGMPGGVTGSPLSRRGSDFSVEVKELGKQIAVGGETICSEDGAIERGVRVFKWVCAGEFKDAVERA